MSTDPNLDAMVQTMKVADQLLEDMHDALAKANDLYDLHPIRIRDGIPVLDHPVAGNVHVTADSSTSVIAVFNRGPGSKWWDPFSWTDAYGKRDYIPFGCGSISMYHEGPAHPGDRVLRIHLRHKLLRKGPEAITEVVKEVLDREQYLELRDICTTPEDATTWGPWMTAIETGA
jgi:hypothetical protein